MKLIKILPNFLTILNGLCGTLAILGISMNLGSPFQILCLVLTGALFDFFDCYFAKILNVKSKIGAQLDSLSDLITFSLVPSFFIFDFLQGKSNELDFLPFLFLRFVF